MTNLDFKAKYPELNYNQAKMLLTDLLALLPKLQNRKPDEDYMYCITCNQIIDTIKSDCFCTIHNLAIDQVRTALTAYVEGSKW